MRRILSTEAANHIGKKVKFSGWVNTIRTHGKIAFLDLRDRKGIIQIFFPPDKLAMMKKIRSEWVVEIIGEVKERPKKMVNEDLPTGHLEVIVEAIKILSEAKTPPFEIDNNGKGISEELRMKYRYLDLRRERMQKNLRKRSAIVHFFRNFLIEKGFIEVETPILTKSTPEGARDFLVPSRKQPGHFYALPQSPQQYKQLLMVGGIEKYFQFARCFRDEDIRADRQAEFTQLDIEASFIDQNEILDLVEEMYIKIVKTLFPGKTIQQVPFPRISYKEAMKKYNSDRPNLRKNLNELAFAFIVDFPMFEKTDEGWRAEHHPFTMPLETDPNKIKKDPQKILARQYDLVLNGNEIAGGSIRSHQPEILEAVFEVLGHNKEEIHQQFGHLFEAFQYGVPPHGGIAVGFERFLMVMLGEDNIREVMAFPKTGDGRGLMMGTPSVNLSQKQLDELHLKIVRKNAK